MIGIVRTKPDGKTMQRLADKTTAEGLKWFRTKRRVRSPAVAPRKKPTA